MIQNLISLPLAATVATGGHSLGYLIGVLVAAVALLLILIIGVRLQAFLALIIVSAVTAMLAGMDITEIPKAIEKGMGSSLGFIAVIIGMGAMFGVMLEHSGGAQKLANTLIKWFGESRAHWAMLLTGFVISIPVFLDVALVIVASVLFSLTKRTGKSLLVFGLPLVVGMAVTHAFVPPTPGPAYVAYTLGVDLGTMILIGIVVGLPTAIITTLFARKMGESMHLPVPENIDVAPEMPESELPSFAPVAFIIALPILLILAGTGVERFIVGTDMPEGLNNSDFGTELARRLKESATWIKTISFLGKPIIALLIGTLAAMLFMASRGGTRDQLLELSTRSLGPAGIIILITGAGGVFKGILISTGIADALQQLFGDSMPLVVIAFLLSLIIRVAQGSATVAMVTTAALVSSIAADGAFSNAHLALVVVAIAAGATACSHVNDSGFWIINRYFGMSVAQTLKTWSVLSCLIGIIGFSIALLLSFFL